ncbi:MAG TPA: BON domain-containing protein [Methylomirabilota bacterium]|jgi:osmotically-inducible protein OsmY|nr:BON domain-containing protein [Methylomirabilota bacterium]
MADRYYDERRDWERGAGRRYRDEGYYGGYYGFPSGREPRGDYGRGGRGEDRGFFERAGDEVRSWFGDDEAQRRRMRDDREDYGRGWGGWRGDERRRGGYADEEVDPDWARKWGYIDAPPGGRGRRDFEPERRYGNYGMYGTGTYGAGSSPSGGGYGYGSWGQSFGGGEGYGERQGYGSEWQSGPYVGRGPRGYTRSDERIREDVCERMSQHGQLDASDIEVRVTAGEVTLQGSVTTRHAKRSAEDLTDSVSGVREVHNQIRVVPEGQQGQQGQPGQQGWGDRHRAA